MAKPNPEFSHLLPLREPTFYILLSLAPAEKHGDAILKDMEELSQGGVKLSTSTLYEALARLLEGGLIERVPDGAQAAAAPQMDQSHPGKPRKAYRLTKTGRGLLEAEVNRMRGLVSAAQRRLGESET